MMRKLAYLGALVALAISAPLSAQDVPAAMVASINGSVQIRAGAGDPAPAAIGQRLAAGDEIIVGDGGRAVLMTSSGGTQVVTATTRIEASGAPPAESMMARTVGVLAQAARSDARSAGGAAGRQGMIRPIPGRTTIVAPRNGLTVQSERPTFTWTATPGQSYDLMIRKIDGGRPMMFSVGSDTTWTLPDGEESLESGARYAWTIFVGGRDGGRPQPQQEFRIIDFDESLELTQFMDEITAFGLDPMDDGLFLTVVAFRDLDLFYDAGEAMAGIESQGAMDADLWLLKGEILTTLGHEAQAQAAFDKADQLKRVN